MKVKVAQKGTFELALLSKTMNVLTKLAKVSTFAKYSHSANDFHLCWGEKAGLPALELLNLDKAPAALHPYPTQNIGLPAAGGQVTSEIVAGQHRYKKLLFIEKKFTDKVFTLVDFCYSIT